MGQIQAQACTECEVRHGAGTLAVDRCQRLYLIGRVSEELCHVLTLPNSVRVMTGALPEDGDSGPIL